MKKTEKAEPWFYEMNREKTRGVGIGKARPIKGGSLEKAVKGPET